MPRASGWMSPNSSDTTKRSRCFRTWADPRSVALTIALGRAGNVRAGSGSTRRATPGVYATPLGRAAAAPCRTLIRRRAPPAERDRGGRAAVHKRGDDLPIAWRGTQFRPWDAPAGQTRDTGATRGVAGLCAVSKGIERSSGPDSALARFAQITVSRQGLRPHEGTDLGRRHRDKGSPPAIDEDGGGRCCRPLGRRCVRVPCSATRMGSRGPTGSVRDCSDLRGRTGSRSRAAGRAWLSSRGHRRPTQLRQWQGSR